MRLSPLLLTFSLVLTSPASHAEEPSQKAAELKAKGDQAMDALRYEEAIELYTKAFDVSKDPALLYNRGRVRQARSEFPRALEDIERFDREAPAALKARVPKLDELLTELRTKVAVLSVHGSVMGADVRVRGQVLGKLPMDGVRVNAGPADLEVTQDGYLPFRKTLDLQGGSTASVDVVLSPVLRGSILAVNAKGPRTRVTIDGETARVAPFEIQLPAGSHRLVAQRSGHPDVERTVLLDPGARRDITFEAPPGRPVTSEWWFWTGVGVIAVAAVSVSVYALTTEASAPSGDFQPGQVSAPLSRF